MRGNRLTCKNGGRNAARQPLQARRDTGHITLCGLERCPEERGTPKNIVSVGRHVMRERPPQQLDCEAPDRFTELPDDRTRVDRAENPFRYECRKPVRILLEIRATLWVGEDRPKPTYTQVEKHLLDESRRL